MPSQWNVSTLADNDLIERLAALRHNERAVLADVLAHMAEVDARKLYCAYGYASMYDYSVEHLGYAEGAAKKRITTARLARRFPTVLSRLAAGAVHLSGLVVLAAHLTEANHVELLDAAANKSKRQIEAMIAARFPRSDVLSLLTPISNRADGEPTEQPAPPDLPGLPDPAEPPEAAAP